MMACSMVAWRRSTARRALAPVRLVCVRSAPERSAPSRLASCKIACLRQSALENGLVGGWRASGMRAFEVRAGEVLSGQVFSGEVLTGEIGAGPRLVPLPGPSRPVPERIGSRASAREARSPGAEELIEGRKVTFRVLHVWGDLVARQLLAHAGGHLAQRAQPCAREARTAERRAFSERQWAADPTRADLAIAASTRAPNRLSLHGDTVGPRERKPDPSRGASTGRSRNRPSRLARRG